MLSDFKFSFPYADPTNYRSAAVGPIADILAHVLLANEGPAYHLYITHILVTNSDLATGTVVEFLNDANVVVYTGYAARTGGFSSAFSNPLMIAENSAIRVRALTAINSLRVSIIGFRGVGYSLR